MIFITIDEHFLEQVSEAILEKTAETALEHESRMPDRARPEVDQTICDLSIAITGDEEIHELNSEYRGIDAPTDVLSFEAYETDPETDRFLLGDVIISYPRVLEQAQQAGHPSEWELKLLVVHGILHLLGYDHSDEEEKAKMWSAQSTILADMGITIQNIG